MATKGTRQVTTAPKYQVLEQTDLTGGLDLRRTPTLLSPERSRKLLNFSLKEPGALRVRPGYRAWSTLSLGSSMGIQGGQRCYLASTSFTLIGYSGHIHRVSDTGGVDTVAVSSAFSKTEPIYITYDRHIAGIFDGASTPLKSTGSSGFTRLGIQASSRRSTLTVSTGGTLSTSEFEITYTYKDRGLYYESNQAPVSTASITDTASASLIVQVPNSTDPQVDAIVLYARNKTSGEAVLRKVSSGGQSTGAGSTYLIASSAWSANDEVPTTHTEAPVLAFAVNWKNRWWGKDATVGNRIWFTDLFQPQAWYALYYIDIPFERGDDITALVVQGDTLVVFGGTKSYLIIGQTSLDFEVRPSAGAVAGALGPRAVEVIESGVIHCASEGVFVFDGATDKLLSYDLEPAWRDLIDHTASTGLAKIACAYDYLQKELRIAVPRLYPLGAAGEWVLDLNRSREGGEPSWTETDRTIGGYILYNGDEATAGDRGRIISWSPTEGTLWQEGTGLTANSSNMRAEFEGPAFSLGLSRARFVDLHADVEPHAGTFSIEVLTDGLSQGSIGLSLGVSGNGVYGTGVYGTATYAGLGRRKCFTELPLSADGRTVVLKGTYEGQESFAWFGYAIGLVPEVYPRQWTE